MAWGAALLCWVADAFRQSCSYGPLARGCGWLALGAALAGWLLAGSGSCSGGVATGWLWELLWRGGYWLALVAALAGWLLAARELGILDRYVS